MERTREDRPTEAAPPPLLVVNARASGTGRAESLARRLAAASGADETWVTGNVDDLHAVLAAAEGRRVVLAGGDGTLHAAINAPGPLPELGLVALGRANNVARALGLPTDPVAAAALAGRGRARPLDVLAVELDGRALYCLEAVSAGLQADARTRYDGTNSGDLVAGARALLAAIHGYRPYVASVFVDGRRAHEGPTAQVFLSNLPYFGFGFRVDPVADPGDGLLEAIVLEAGSRRELLSLLAAARGGRHLDRAGATLVRGREARLEGFVPLAGDGEPLGDGAVSARVQQGRLRLVAP
jgi:diacylglycerol kinase (ATP)